MKIVCFSDIHENFSKKLLKTMPDGDVLVFAGDYSGHGLTGPTISFLKWFNEFPHKNKIFIAGNHDFLAEQDPKFFNELVSEHCPTANYLNDSGITLNGVNFYGSPITPYFFDWAFNRFPQDLKKTWAKIPENTDVLITHGPAKGILDFVHEENVGCQYLLNRIRKLKIKTHICGHIHDQHGIREEDGIKFINASLLDDAYKLVYEPIVIEV